jgi:hypothetical protein
VSIPRRHGGSRVGFGLAHLGAFRTTIAPAAPADKAGLIAAVFVVCYLAFSIPALIAGAATSRVGLHQTAVVYSASIAALVAAATGTFLFRRHTPSSRPGRAAAHEHARPRVSLAGLARFLRPTPALAGIRGTARLMLAVVASAAVLSAPGTGRTPAPTGRCGVAFLHVPRLHGVQPWPPADHWSDSLLYPHTEQASAEPVAYASGPPHSGQGGDRAGSGWRPRGAPRSAGSPRGRRRSRCVIGSASGSIPRPALAAGCSGMYGSQPITGSWTWYREVRLRRRVR